MVRSLIVAGPTASGKSALAMAIAKTAGGEIISCDSVQLYRGFDIGSAKPTVAEQSEIPHHLLDVADWRDNYDAARFARAARQKVAEVAARGRLPVIAGGTGLYLRAMLQQDFHDDLPSDETLRSELRGQAPDVLYQRLQTLDPRRAAEIHPHDQFRVIRALEINILTGAPVPAKTGASGQHGKDYYVVILDPERKVLHERIAARTRLMLEQGLLEEVRQLIAAGVDPGCKPMQSIGYKQCADVIAGRSSESDLYEKIFAATRQYAKRQCTWFRKTAFDLRLNEASAGPDMISQILAACQA